MQHRGACYGLVAPLFEQAKVVANHLAEFGIGRYAGSQTSTKLKVTGIDLFSAGDFTGGAGTEELVFKDAARGVYKKIVVQGNKIKGAVLYGDTVDGAWYFQLMRDGTAINDFRENVLFGQAHIGDSGTAGADAVTLLPDTAEICGCNGVCKGDIVKAITKKNLFTLDEVRAHTKASSSCGSCTGLVEQLLANTLGGDYSEAPAKKPMCPCTIYTHEEVRAAIVREKLKSIPAAMQFLEWKTPDGCHKCRPGLNFYLLCAWPGEYQDDKQSRFINERAHGNIQRDGTYSVVPRMWGGVTSAKELRAIADVAEKYAVPTVKVTGGQRIDLLGVKKEDLPNVWRDLNAAGFVSGHAYGKALRTVKTCVGKEWCRFGTQDSTGLGIRMERVTWGSWHPHKVKLAVSGCPRNCAEATIKDLGVVCVDSGYELHVGGNGGIKIRATDFLCKVATEEEVIEYCCAYLQLYREEARYLERTAPWIERVGLSHVRERIVDDADGRKALYARFLESQKYSQTDPWAERAAGVQAEEFAPLRAEVAAGARVVSWVDLGPLTALPERGARCVRVGGLAIAVFRTSTGEVFALRDQCPHRGGPLSQGIVHGTRVTCPLHDWVIDLDDGPGDGRGRRLDGDLQRARRRRPHRARAAGGAARASLMSAVRTTCPYCGVGCGLVAARAADGELRDPRRSRASGELRARLLEGRGARRDARPRRPAAASRDSRRARRAGTRRSTPSPAASRARSPRTAPTPSRSTSPASS